MRTWYGSRINDTLLAELVAGLVMHAPLVGAIKLVAAPIYACAAAADR